MPEWVTHSRAKSFRLPISYGLRDARKKRGSPSQSFLIIFIHGQQARTESFRLERHRRDRCNHKENSTRYHSLMIVVSF
jgi:hypothetical protein